VYLRYSDKIIRGSLATKQRVVPVPMSTVIRSVKLALLSDQAPFAQAKGGPRGLLHYTTPPPRRTGARRAIQDYYQTMGVDKGATPEGHQTPTTSWRAKYQ
jgi:hypothetical protein